MTTRHAATRAALDHFNRLPVYRNENVQFDEEEVRGAAPSRSPPPSPA